MAMTTIALAVGMQHMAERGALIRRLLGRRDARVDDRHLLTRPALTREITAVELWLPAPRRAAPAVASPWAASAPRLGELLEEGRPADTASRSLHDLLAAAALCNDAELARPGEERAAWTVLGTRRKERSSSLRPRRASISTLREQSPGRLELRSTPDAN